LAFTLNTRTDSRSISRSTLPSNYVLPDRTVLRIVSIFSSTYSPRPQPLPALEFDGLSGYHSKASSTGRSQGWWYCYSYFIHVDLHGVVAPTTARRSCSDASRFSWAYSRSIICVLGWSDRRSGWVKTLAKILWADFRRHRCIFSRHPST